MRDRYTLHLKNFRSIRDAKIDIAPLTVVYGPNGSGKSSLIYGLLTLKNFLANPNQNIPSLFSYPTISLGGFEEVASDHVKDKTISFSLRVSSASESVEYVLGIGEAGGRTEIEFDGNDTTWNLFALSLDIPFPYPANQSDTHSVEPSAEGDYFDVQWNGVTLTGDVSDPASHECRLNLLESVNSPMELARATRFVPLRRGFSMPAYSISSLTPDLSTDMEVASLLATDRHLKYEVSHQVEFVADRRVDIHMQPGTSTFTVDSVPRNGGTAVSMVNDGFGVNQVVHMLTVCIGSESKIIAIEEPEIHLHPSMVRKLVHAMVDITSNMHKRIIVSTHSETFVLALLAQIAKGKIGVDDVSFILAEKEDGKSRFTNQEATPEGQIQGGLRSFITGELEDMAVLFGQSSETG